MINPTFLPPDLSPRSIEYKSYLYKIHDWYRIIFSAMFDISYRVLFAIACIENRSIMTDGVLRGDDAGVRYCSTFVRRANVGAYTDTYHLSVSGLRAKYRSDTFY